LQHTTNCYKATGGKYVSPQAHMDDF
jgi:hypothetical protein